MRVGRTLLRGAFRRFIPVSASLCIVDLQSTNGGMVALNELVGNVAFLM